MRSSWVTASTTASGSATWADVVAVKLRPSAATTRVDSGAPPRLAVAPVRFDPTTVISVPPLEGPLTGLMLVMVAAAAIWYCVAAAPVPAISGLPDVPGVVPE